MNQPARAIPRRAVVSWMLYDLANVIFSMGVISLYFSLYVSVAVGPARADSLLGGISAVSMGIMFLLSPLLGAMTDRARRRMPFLVWATLVCCACTALIARGPFGISAILFVIANGAYQAGVQFYDSLLPEVTTEQNRGRINGIAIGAGYLGSYIAVGGGLLMTHKGHDFPFPAYFLFVAVAFLTLALPCFLFVKERVNRNPRPIFAWGAVTESARETLRTLKSGHQYPGLLRFLVGRAFYTDAINTVILFMSLYTMNVAVASGLSRDDGQRKAQLVLMSAITAAIAGGIIWGFVVDRLGAKRTLMIVLAGWLGTFTLAALVGFLGLPLVWLYVVACAAGICLGGTWASDRPLMLRLTPPARVGEFYGLYGMVGRFSAVTGPLVWGATTWLTVERLHMPVLRGEAFAILSLLAMMVVAVAIVRPVSDAPRQWQAPARPVLNVAD
ncbi:MAG: MFS transporter [Gemmatimonadota bacterium]|nr:MFS transporter [Gemmatimonadota bacterium]MDE3173007.1 MFS transporter [Gemmatimonadota bacterium]